MNNDIKINFEVDILVVGFLFGCGFFVCLVFCCVIFGFEIARFVLLPLADKTDLLHLKYG